MTSIPFTTDLCHFHRRAKLKGKKVSAFQNYKSIKQELLFMEPDRLWLLIQMRNTCRWVYKIILMSSNSISAYRFKKSCWRLQTIGSLYLSNKWFMKFINFSIYKKSYELKHCQISTDFDNNINRKLRKIFKIENFRFYHLRPTILLKKRS